MRGPLLRELVEAHEMDDAATSFPNIEVLADALGQLSERLGSPILWPVGNAAERLVGATILRGRGSVRVRGSATDLNDERVLLVTVSAVTALELTATADYARRFGASDVQACAVALSRQPESSGMTKVDAWHDLGASRSESAELVSLAR